MDNEERLAHISKAAEAMRPGWGYLVAEVDARIADLTESLINNNDEQTRGQIKAMRWVKELPETLQHERRALSEAISEEAASD